MGRILIFLRLVDCLTNDLSHLYYFNRSEVCFLTAFYKSPESEIENTTLVVVVQEGRI